MRQFIILSFILLSVLPSHAGKDRGGGFFVSVNGEYRLLDTVEAEQKGIEYIRSIEDLPGFKEVVAPTLLRLHDLAPGLARELWKIASKTWMYVGVEPEAPEDPMTDLNVVVCGVQDKIEIKIYKPCFEKAKSIQDQGELLFHELVRGLGLVVDMNKRAGNWNAKDIRVISHRLLYNVDMTADQLQNLLRYNGVRNVSIPYPLTLKDLMGPDLKFLSAFAYLDFEPRLFPELFSNTRDVLVGVYLGRLADSGKLCGFDIVPSLAINSFDIKRVYGLPQNKKGKHYELYEPASTIKLGSEDNPTQFYADIIDIYKLSASALVNLGPSGITEVTFYDNLIKPSPRARSGRKAYWAHKNICQNIRKMR